MAQYSFTSTSKWLDKNNNQYHTIPYNSKEATKSTDKADVIRDIEDGHFDSIKNKAIKEIGHSNIEYVKNSMITFYEKV